MKRKTKNEPPQYPSVEWVTFALLGRPTVSTLRKTHSVMTEPVRREIQQGCVKYWRELVRDGVDDSVVVSFFTDSISQDV